MHPLRRRHSASSVAPLLAQAQDALDRKDYAAAAPLLEKVVAAKPTDALPHFDLGVAYSQLKRNPEAIAEFRQAISLDPNYAPAHLNLGLLLLDSDPAAAAASFERAAQLMPGQVRPVYLAAEALERAGKRAEAIAQYRAAVALAPKDDAILDRACSRAACRRPIPGGRIKLSPGARTEARFRARAVRPGRIFAPPAEERRGRRYSQGLFAEHSRRPPGPLRARRRAANSEPPGRLPRRIGPARCRRRAQRRSRQAARQHLYAAEEVDRRGRRIHQSAGRLR